MKRLHLFLAIGLAFCLGAWRGGQQVAITVTPPTTPDIDWNFATNTATGCTFATCLTVARADGGASTDLLPTSASGASYNTFAADTLRLTSGSGLLIEEARTNYLLNSTAPATQTTGTLPTGSAYVLWVNGGGTATMTAGTATGCGTGAATQGNPITLTITVAGTCHVAVTGSLNAFQLEQGAGSGSPNFGTSLIVTGASTVQRPADDIELASTALTDIQGTAGWMSAKFLVSPAAVTLYQSIQGVPRIVGANSNNMRWAPNFGPSTAGEFDWTRNTGTNLAFPSNKYTGGVAVGSVSWGAGGLVVTLANQAVGTATEGTDATYTTVYLGNRGGLDRALNGYIAHWQIGTTQPTNAFLQAQTPS